MATLGLLAMVAFLRELELSRPAAIFGGVIFAWQGDLLPFRLSGPLCLHGDVAVLRPRGVGRPPFRAHRHWAYALISGVCCGLMVSLQPDRGAIASLLIGVLFIASIFRRSPVGGARPGPVRDRGDGGRAGSAAVDFQEQY